MSESGFSAAPAYRRVADEIRDRILSGELRPGDSVPSARQISAEWGVAAATAARVQAYLRSQGLTESIPGVGSVVTNRASSAKDYISGSAAGRIYGGSKIATILSSELTTADSVIADALGVEVSASVVRRERVTKTLDGHAESVSVSWLPGDRIKEAPLLLKRSRIPEGSFAYLAARLGVVAQLGREQLSVGEADELAAEQLGVPLGSAVLLSRDWFETSSGMVLQYGESRRRPDAWVTYDFNL
jgi:DNA-binding GntR family transcriptional regulator